MHNKNFYVMSENEHGGYPICWDIYATENEAWHAASLIGWREGINCWVET